MTNFLHFNRFLFLVIFLNNNHHCSKKCKKDSKSFNGWEKSKRSQIHGIERYKYQVSVGK